MPKKTREQKIRSQQRLERSNSFTFEYQPKMVNSISKYQNSQSTSHSDIRKTLVLGIIIIGFEILIYIYSKRFGW